jgi:hypothetical protein
VGKSRKLDLRPRLPAIDCKSLTPHARELARAREYPNNQPPHHCSPPREFHCKQWPRSVNLKSGHYEPVAEIAEAVRAVNQAKGLNVELSA